MYVFLFFMRRIKAKRADGIFPSPRAFKHNSAKSNELNYLGIVDYAVHILWLLLGGGSCSKQKIGFPKKDEVFFWGRGTTTKRFCVFVYKKRIGAQFVVTR